ncbi:MAG: N-acetylmuramoyl-L-alanine amidase [Oscillospiraceae bacterium]
MKTIENSIISKGVKSYINPFTIQKIICGLWAIFCIFTCFSHGQNLNELFYGIGICTVQSRVTSAYPLPTQAPYVVAIDPGHGGMDTGAQSIIDELYLCETTAKYLYDFLDKDQNFSPFYTREWGSDPSSELRARRADENFSAVLISIHGNYDGSSRRSHGFECFPTPPGREYSKKSMDLALCIASQMEKAGNHLRGENNCGIRFAYYSGNSKRMAEISDTKVHSQKSFGIIEKPSCPAVLVEQCFITNYNDVENWGRDDGCKKSAQVYYKALCRYFSTQPKGE